MPDRVISVPQATQIATRIKNKFDNVNGRLDQQGEFISDFKADAATSFTWVQGGINTNIGTNTEDNTRIRSSGFKSYDGCESVEVTIPSDYQAVAIELNGTGSPQRDYFVRSIPDSGYTAQSFSFVPVEGYYYRFCIKRTSNADISPAQVPSGFAVTEQRKRIPNIFETMFNTNVGNCGILCAKEHNFVDGTAPTYEWYLLGDPATNKVYYSKDMTRKEYLFTFGENLGYWSFGIDSNNNIICCKQSEYLSDNLEHDDDLRVNPIVYLFSEKYSIPHEVDFGESLKPCGWLSSVGFICLADGSILIAEYTRPVVSTANIWRISGSPTNAANWSVRQTFELSGSGTGFKHIHCVQQDFYTGVCYFSTGDDDTSSHWYYSTDNGTTWVLGKGNSEKYCRFLNLIFTQEYIYWSTDSNKPGYHWMFRAARKSNGVLDFDNITDLLEIPLVSNLATYGCCYFPEYKALLLMERCDSEVQMSMPVRLYDIETNTLHNVWTFVPVASRTTGGHLGFRTRFCTWYPKGNAVRCAWHLRGTSLGSRGFNENAMFGNLGMTDASYNINNAEIRIYKDGSTYRMTLDTAYI